MSEITEPAAPAAAAESWNRFDDAIFAQRACNPIALANHFARRFKEVSAEQGGFDAARQDPALKLIVYQLWYLMGGPKIEDQYSALYDYCAAHATDPIHKKTLVD